MIKLEGLFAGMSLFSQVDENAILSATSLFTKKLLMSDLKNRVVELEIKISHQEHTIEELNQMVITLQQQNDLLQQQQKIIQQMIVTLQDTAQKETADPPPPHY